MGNIRTSFVKRISKELIETHPGKFTTDFEENKKLVFILKATEIMRVIIMQHPGSKGEKISLTNMTEASSKQAPRTSVKH